MGQQTGWARGALLYLGVLEMGLLLCMARVDRDIIVDGKSW